MTPWLVVSLVVSGSVGAGGSQCLFAEDQFQRANKMRRQVAVDKTQRKIDARKGVYEDVAKLEESHVNRRLGRAVGLLDLLVKKKDGTRCNGTCTATLIDRDLIITNHHCVPGRGSGSKVEEAELRLGFLDPDKMMGNPYKVSVKPVESDPQLDYAILRVVEDVPVDKYPPLRLLTESVRNGQRMVILHHPKARPMQFSDHSCHAGRPAISPDGELVHFCDTKAGSSGALLFDDQTSRVLGLHFQGVSDPSTMSGLRNHATPIDALLRRSPILKRLSARAEPTVQDVASPDGISDGSKKAAEDGPDRTITLPTNSERPTPAGMVLVPKGPFIMGCNDYVDDECDGDEFTKRRVELPAFYIDKLEVTVAEYEACVQANRCTAKGLTTPRRAGRARMETAWACNWGRAGRKNHPINCITWAQAQAYCQWKGKSLPSEQEWEKAARGTDGRKYPWGAQPYGKTRYANISDLTARKAQPRWPYPIPKGYDDGFHGTAPVGSFPEGAAPSGALDMIGNVMEWTIDWLVRNERRALRGGAYTSEPYYARASARYGFPPGDRFAFAGFRCAMLK